VSAVYLQQFPSYSNHNCKYRHFYVPRPSFFCLPWGSPCGNHAKRCMNENSIQCLLNPSQHVPIYLQQFPSYSNRKCKKSQFSRPAAHIFVSPGDAPAIITQYVAWMERHSMLVKHLAACTHLSSTVSQLFEPQVQKNRRFHVPQPTILFPLETPLRLSPDKLHGWKDNSMLAKPLAACSYLSSIVSELYDA